MRSWSRLSEKLPEEVRESEEAARFRWLLEEMHEANHRLKDAINKDAGVTKSASQLDAVMK